MKNDILVVRMIIHYIKLVHVYLEALYLMLCIDSQSKGIKFGPEKASYLRELRKIFLARKKMSNSIGF